MNLSPPRSERMRYVLSHDRGCNMNVLTWLEEIIICFVFSIMPHCSRNHYYKNNINSVLFARQKMYRNTDKSTNLIITSIPRIFSVLNSTFLFHLPLCRLKKVVLIVVIYVIYYFKCRHTVFVWVCVYVCILLSKSYK